jgi:hypothetical protein
MADRFPSTRSIAGAALSAATLAEVKMLLRDFKARVDRTCRWPSARLAALIRAIDTFLRSPSIQQLDAVRRALDVWRDRDPNEFNRRGLPILGELERALTSAEALCPREGMIPIVDLTAHPRFAPAEWQPFDILNSANCYAYACNDPNGHVAGELPQPGLLMASTRKDELLLHARMVNREIAGAPHGPLRYRHWLLRRRVELDNEVRRAQGSAGLSRLLESEHAGYQPTNIDGHYLVAMFVSAEDFHWYRQDDTGYWSHKNGHAPPADTGADGRRIRDPRDAPLPGYHCSGFYRVPKGGARTASFPPAGHLTDEQEVILRKAFPSAKRYPGHAPESSVVRAGARHSPSSSLHPRGQPADE